MSTQNYSLDFEGSLPPSAQDGMQRAIEHADPRWKQAASSCVFIAARKQREITVDDVWEELERVNEQRKRDKLPTFVTHNAGAIGPVMKQCADQETHGWIRWTERFTRSRIAHKNGNLHRVWQSLVYPGGGGMTRSKRFELALILACLDVLLAVITYARWQG